MSASTDFDFWIGRWSVRNERLKGRLCGSTEWEEFAASAEARFLPGGLGNIDQFVITDDWRPARPAASAAQGSFRISADDRLLCETACPGFVGLTVRLFEPSTKLWRIYWADNMRGIFDPPVIGQFTDGVGTFEGDDQHEGAPVRVRFKWTHDPPRTARWEQAFSTDGGASWETNWIMHMTRED